MTKFSALFLLSYRLLMNPPIELSIAFYPHKRYLTPTKTPLMELKTQ